MLFNTYAPAAALQPYIEMYWLLSGYIKRKERITLMPDGGINLVLNLGEKISSVKFNKPISNERIYLVGTMMQTDEQVLHGEVLLSEIPLCPNI